MPANLVSSLAGWFATHLVAISFLGFILVGLVVFRVIDMPAGQWVDTERPRPSVEAEFGQPLGSPEGATEASLGPATAARGDRGETGEAPSDRLSQDAGRPSKPSSPKLIGGSLPLYEPDAASSTGFSQHAVGDPFRPPYETPVTETISREVLVQDARRAFWNGDFEAAERVYLALLSAYPEDADAFGELGNLYHSMGRTEAALDAYFEAGLRLQATGEREKLLQVIDFLLEEGDERAHQLTP